MLVAYLNFNGKTEEAFKFYQSVLGGKFTAVQRFSDTPHGANMPENERNLIMHMQLETATGDSLMGSDHLESMGMGPLIVGNNFSLSVLPESEAEAKRIFDGLAQGGNVLMPIDKVFWGAYFGMLIDRYGIKWLVNYVYTS